MKKYLVAGLLTIASCTSSRNKNNEPTPLQEHSSFALSKRGGGDMVSELYEELSEKDPQLKQLEDAIEQLNDYKADSIKQYSNYDEKSRNYYTTAERHISSITDSILKQKVKLEIEKSLEAYRQTIAAHQSIMDGIALKTQTLNDLHEVLKIVRTLPVIVNYQQKNLPATKPLSFIDKKYEIVLKQIDTLINKQKL